jgi:hypothetical protein
MADFFDFGFTAVDEDELEIVKAQIDTTGTIVDELERVQGKLDALYNAFIPLLNNLKSNPQKEYILWPDRLAKVEAFEDHLQEIYSKET